MAQTQRAVLIILDGFGIGKDSPFNAIKNAKMPFYQDLWKKYPHSQLLTHGTSVGLPDGVMGNSEVGHMTLGSGRIVYQDLTRISMAIQNREFFKNHVLRETLQTGAKHTGRVHLMGLLSDGGVHSHIDHLWALLDLCDELQISQVFIQAFLDGRDTPPTSGVHYIRKLLQHPLFKTHAQVASIMGRFWAMDRDKRWDRISRAYATLTGQVHLSDERTDPISVIEKSYSSGKTDEFLEPVLLQSVGTIQDGDSLVFFNFRADRAREITEALTSTEFNHFNRGKPVCLSAFASMTVYDRNFKIPVAFEPQSLDHIFGEWLSEKKLHQFRIAETEKYAHVTFFFNGGREKPFSGEDRVLIPSPRDVPTYDLKPEMSAFQVAEEAAQRIASKQYDFVLINFANADMVGHTGNYDAAIRALQALDQCLAKVIGTAEKSGYHVILTADHGNAEEMRDQQGQIHTQHTLNPVPIVWIAPGTRIAPQSERRTLRDGGLQDVMPTLCKIMQIPIPPGAKGTPLC